MSSSIPTERQFRDFIKAYEVKERGNIDALIDDLVASFNSGEKLSKDEVQSFADLCEVSRSERAQKIQRHVVFRWMDSQCGINDALKSMNRAIKRLYPSENYNVIIPFSERLLKNLYPTNKDEMDFSAWGKFFLRDRLEEHRDSNYYGLLLPVAKAFSAYFYKDRPKHLRKIRETRSNVTKQLSMLTQYLERATEQEINESDYDAAGLRNIMENLIRLQNKVERHYEKIEIELTAATRNDGHAKERILVLDLIRGLRRLGYRPGAAALSDFLTCDGVKNRPDNRSIQRWISEWRRIEADRNSRKT